MIKSDLPAKLLAGGRPVEGFQDSSASTNRRAQVIGTVEDHGAPPVIICGFYAPRQFKGICISAIQGAYASSCLCC